MMIRILIVQEADNYDHQAWENADMVVHVTNVQPAEVQQVVVNRRKSVPGCTAGLIARQIQTQLSV